MTGSIDWYAHPGARHWRCPPLPDQTLRFHASLPGYQPTALVPLPRLAAELAVGQVWVKDESSRFGLPAFKALGASWATLRRLADHLGGEPAANLDDLRQRLADLPPVELVTATDGNHGRAVARMARLVGARAHIFVPLVVPLAARSAIAGEGAEVTVVDGSYDEAVSWAASYAGADQARFLIQDTAWPGYERVPGWIVEGYATLVVEVDQQLAGAGTGPAGLIVVPVGVGSLAQAVLAHYRSQPEPPAVL
ncbi:MAG TPA: pyridoxal-phosphate dependent enzyme, partial [Micromonosporaceae bacterium]